MKNKQLIKDIFKVGMGGILLGFAYAKLIVPNQIISGGATSLSMIFSKITSLPIEFYTKVFTLGFLLLSFIFLGAKNVVLSLLSSFMYVQSFAYFYATNFNIQTHLIFDVMLAAVFIGSGYYLAISSDASTVGVEVIALIFQKYYPKQPLVRSIRILNILVLLLGYLVFGLESILIGIIFTMLYSKVLNSMLKLKERRTI